MNWTLNKIRKTFLDFFKEKKHTVVSSSPLVPANDPTLLFTNAGMVQFKDVFLGQDKRPYTRATTAQRCVRAGGKHNDLENVGYTARHHTFFEMLGNFSFGDYFKEEAIQYAWEFLTEVLKLPKEKLWITVFENDDEAADIWLKKIKVDPNRFSRCGEKDNFWAMGDTGPCGPCTEIFYDHGPDVAGGPPGSKDADGDRYIEIWNLVFMQFQRDADGTLTPLPKPSVDTGMGLERLAAVLQGVHSNYEIDLFQHLIETISKITACTDKSNSSLRVIADHIRSCSFLITDGIVPSNEGRGYVLRRIIRRAIRHGHKLGMREPFFYKLVQPLVNEMGDAYPELKKAQFVVEKVLLQEEQQFARTIEQGIKIFEHDVATLHNKLIPGETIFRLYDTYGFPVDLTADMARERGFELDLADFEREMEKQRKLSQASSRFTMEMIATEIVIKDETEFSGYETMQHDAKVIALLQDGKAVEQLNAGEKGVVILERTPFYAEAGGQVGDSGKLTNKDVEFVVEDTQKQAQAYLHIGKLISGTLKLNDRVEAVVDEDKRRRTMANHSATHLLHAALRKVLGEHVIQKGSLVAPDRLRFDFTHFEALTREQILQIENIVNNEIQKNYKVETEIMSPEEAKKLGAMALFGEKYGDKVRVLSMGDFSKELCGGTHTERTGDVGLFKIIEETSVAAGVRRIEAVTSKGAIEWVNDLQSTLQQIASLYKTNSSDVLNKISQSLQQKQQLEKQLEQLHQQLASFKGQSLLQQAKEHNGKTILIAEIKDISADQLKPLVEQLKSQLKSGVVLLGLVQDDKVSLVSGVTKDVTDKIKAGDLVNFAASFVGGKGGGRPDLAQAGGTNVKALKKALDEAEKWLKDALSSKKG